MLNVMSDDRNLPIHESFIQSIGSADLKDLLIDVAQITLESITDLEVLKRLPVVGSIVHTYGAIKSVRDRFYLKKIFRFFARVGEIPQEQRDAFVQRMRADPRRAQQVGESFAVWLDRLDDEEKAELLAKVFELYACGKIDFDRSSRFAAVIDRAHIPYLLQLRDGYRDDDVKSHLLALGLLRVTAKQADVDRQMHLDRARRDIELVKMELSDDGRVFQEYVVGEMPVKMRITERIHTPSKARL